MKAALKLSVIALGALWVTGCEQESDIAPVTVDPAPTSERAEERAERARTPGELPSTSNPEAPRIPERRSAEPEEEEAPRSRPSTSTAESGGLWVIDDVGDAVGLLVRRGSDDNLVYRAIYDLVTVFHPESGLFFEITMSDGVVRRPSTTFFASASCDNPIGVSYGGCAECRSAPGIGVLHGESWYQVTPGVTYEVTSAGSTMGSGLQDDCSSHHTDSAKVFPLEALSGPTPPTSFTAPLHFAWR